MKSINHHAMGRRKLRFGLWYAFRNPPEWRTSYENLYAEVLDQIAWAETIGYDDVWLTEHHLRSARTRRRRASPGATSG